jgi:peroxiredoxin family protein
MNQYERIKFLIADYNPEAKFLDGFDNAIIGYTVNTHGNKVCVYNTYEILKILIKEHNMSKTEAFEYYDFNIEQGYIGEHQPVYVDYLIGAI